MDNQKLQQFMWCYQQLGLIVADNMAESSRQDEDIRKIENIFVVKIPELIKKSAPADIYDLLQELQYNYEFLHDCIVYGSLKRKNVIGLGGGFSSGKSSFINTMMGQGEILPENINPSTSVPAYIVYGSKNRVSGINIFKKQMELDLFSINAISHGFGSVFDDMKSIELGHILRNLVLSTPLFEYKNIAFLDTPGYSKPDDKNYSAKTDEMVARQQLNTTNYILWFAPVSESGSLAETDILFIKSLREDLHISVICSKANRRTKEQREQIKQKILRQVELAKLNVDNIFFFDTETPKGLDAEKIMALISDYNSKQYDGSALGKNMKKFFIRIEEYYENKDKEIAQKVNRMNQATLCIENDYLVRDGLQALINDMKSERNQLKLYKEKMKELEIELCKLVSCISNRYGFDFVIPEYSALMSEIHGENMAMNTQKRSGFARANSSFSKLAKGRFEEC